MKYGAIGGFGQFAFAKTAFDYIEKALPQKQGKSAFTQKEIANRTRQAA